MGIGFCCKLFGSGVLVGFLDKYDKGSGIYGSKRFQGFARDLLVTLSTLLRGSIYEKLRWTFKLYDINGDGCITRSELGEVVMAVHELMGRRHHAEEERKAREQLDRVFKKLDLNQDGVITIEEFIESCLKVSFSTVKQLQQSRIESIRAVSLPLLIDIFVSLCGSTFRRE
ncbi:Calsenilin [Harpegnathos saltator]|uniref:Calsenilin n=1 Tax=Harpegnathos saltator TaxID=610380 RepID=E2BWF2_HARSA|nr:Calsenilin [Harpegnathos saltator]